MQGIVTGICRDLLLSSLEAAIPRTCPCPYNRLTTVWQRLTIVWPHLQPLTIASPLFHATVFVAAPQL